MHLILTGATGLVGTAVLRAMLVDSSVTKISILSRRPVAQADGQEKANVIIHKDYEKYESDLVEKLKDADGCVWAQGISQSQVNKEDYIKITKTYPLSFANFLLTLPTSKPVTFVYVSGEGVTHQPGRFTLLFGRVKGEAELGLLALARDNPNKISTYIGRPGGVDPTNHPEIRAYVPRIPGVMGLFRGPLLGATRALKESMLSPTKELGEALLELAKKRGEELSGEGIESGRIATNFGLRKMKGI